METKQVPNKSCQTSQLAWVKKYLNNGDQQKVAKELKVDRSTVNKVVNGKLSSSKILTALIKKASENKQEIDQNNKAIDALKK